MTKITRLPGTQITAKSLLEHQAQQTDGIKAAVILILDDEGMPHACWSQMRQADRGWLARYFSRLVDREFEVLDERDDEIEE